MRDAETIEAELMEIGAIADETIKFDAIVAWCAAHPDEVAFALHHLLRRRKHKADAPEK
jgi:membrane-bound lytic murein transglycosylase